MYSLNKIIRTISLIGAFVLVTFAVSSTARAVDPPPDGGYPANNTAEGEDAILSLTTGVVNTALAPATNPIVNAGFETGDLTGWLTYPVTDGDVTSAEAHNGTYSMEMEPVDIIYQDFAPADKLHAKRLRFWAKTNDIVSGTAYARVYYRDGTSDSLLFSTGLSSVWTAFTLTLKPKKIVIEVLIETGETPPIYVDDVRLKEFP